MFETKCEAALIKSEKVVLRHSTYRRNQRSTQRTMSPPIRLRLSRKRHSWGDLRRSSRRNSLLSSSLASCLTLAGKRRRVNIALFIKVLLDYLERCDRSLMQFTKKVSFGSSNYRLSLKTTSRSYAEDKDDNLQVVKLATSQCLLVQPLRWLTSLDFHYFGNR